MFSMQMLILKLQERLSLFSDSRLGRSTLAPLNILLPVASLSFALVLKVFSEHRKQAIRVRVAALQTNHPSKNTSLCLLY